MTHGDHLDDFQRACVTSVTCSHARRWSSAHLKTNGKKPPAQGGTIHPESAGGDEPPREAVDVEDGPRRHALTRAAEAMPLHHMPEDALGESPCCRGHAFNPLLLPSVPSVVYVASPRSSPRAAAPWWGRSAVSVCPRVRVSVRPSLVPRPLPVRTVRPVLLLKTTCEKKKNIIAIHGNALRT